MNTLDATDVRMMLAQLNMAVAACTQAHRAAITGRDPYVSIIEALALTEAVRADLMRAAVSDVAVETAP